LSQDTTADVVVVGAGIAGLTTAYLLAREGKRVVVLENGVRGYGQTGASNGMLSQWNNDYYYEVQKIAGTERARLAAQSHAAAIDFVRETTKMEGIKCGFEQVPSYVFAHHERGDWPSPAGKNKLSKELDVCKRLGVDAYMQSLGETPEVGNIKEALVFNNSANINPLQYIDGLAEAVVKHGGVIHEDTRVKGGVITGPSKGVVQTLAGPTVKARDGVVLATNSPINRDQIWVHNRQLPYRSYLIALEVPSGSVRNAHYHDTDAPQHSVRVVAGKGKDMLIVQGEPHQHGYTPSKIGDPFARLEQWARHHFPQAGSIAAAWSTIDYQPADLLGLYGQDPLDAENPPNYILTGHSGQELTGGTIGAQVVSSLILNKPVPWAEVYKPGRVLSGATTKYVPELTTYFSTVGASILKHVIPRNLEDVKGMLLPSSVEKDMKPGEGKVVQHGWRKKALYMEPDGKTLKMHSALCTHLGCCVEWNPHMSTFDCPCHGSEFDACGKCVHAPAVADLEDLGTKVIHTGH